MEWKFFHPKADMEMLGLVPFFIQDDDPDNAAQQIAKRYIAGWDPMKGFKVLPTGIVYPGDEERILLAETTLRKETIRFYRGAWVGIFQPDGSHEIALVD